MNNLINTMNDVLDNWKKEYDLSYDVPMCFEFDEAQKCISFLGKPVACVGDEVLESADVTAERMVFAFSGERYIYVYIAWPEDKAPYVSSVLLGYNFNFKE